jgi:hypothetical protein
MTIRALVALTTLVLSTQLLAADPKAAQTLARCVDDSAVAVVRVDLKQVDAEAAAKRLAEFAGTGLVGIDLPSLNSLAATVQALQAAGAHTVCAVFMPAPLSDRNPYYVAIVEPGRDVPALVRQIETKTPNPSRLFVLAADVESFAAVAAFGDAVVAGDRAVVARLKKRAPAHRPELESAWAAAGSVPIALLLVPSADQRKAIEETLPELPQMIGGGPTAVLTQGLIWAAATYTPDNQSLELAVQSQSPAAAAALRHYLRDLPGKVQGASWMKTLFPEGRLPDALVPTVQNDRLTLSVKRSDPGVAVLEQAFAEGGKAVRSSLWRTTRRDHLQFMALAMHNYYDVHRRFPAQANYDKNGRPLLSWRVHILPFIEEGKLYKEFHLDEAWDSEHNQKLIERIPHIYRSPELSFQDYGKTTFLGVAGKHAFFQGTEGITIRQITDGTVNTLMVVEAPPSQAVVWTKPDDFDVDPGHLHERLFQGRDSFGAAMCDGSAYVIGKATTEDTLRAHYTINGGEIIPSGN